ncbi:hypothetical protein QR98_0064780 [Sarcoptes scabiei]|uniref:Uncharacterized protein n=1 Tax=Sarcoptes scabiei TaxID=52283 RepID=A0A132ABL8_SARSC|nr:hypothetical protein QR98_0064780 [Sarcoptes scabiei]
MLMMNNENKMDNEKCLNENDFEKKMSILSLNQNDSSMRKISPKCSGEESRIENETVRFTGQSNIFFLSI